MLSSRHDGLFAPAEIRAALRLHALAVDVEHLNDPVEVDLALLALNGQVLELGLHLLFRDLVDPLPDTFMLGNNELFSCNRVRLKRHNVDRRKTNTSQINVGPNRPSVYPKHCIQTLRRLLEIHSKQPDRNVMNKHSPG